MPSRKPREPASRAAVLDADLEAGLKRLKLAAVRKMAPEVLQTAKVQRWPPDELLRTLVEAEIAARDASNESTRRKAAGFPVTRRLEDFVLSESSVPRVTFDHLASLDWIDAAENVVLVGPAGTGKSHILLGIGEAAVVSVVASATCRRHRSSRRSMAGSRTTRWVGSSSACSVTTW